MLLRCNDCNSWRLPGCLHCDVCLSTDSRWERASGHGTVYSFGIVHDEQATDNNDLPYNVAVVELEEGPFLPTNLVGLSNDDIKIGMPVVISWEHHEDVSVPKFRPV